MVTPSVYIKDGKYMSAETLFGLSTDSKPTSVANGTRFIEMNTSTIYFFDAEHDDWLEWGHGK